MYARARVLLPAPVARYVLYFEAAIEDAVGAFAKALAPGARLLDAGAGEEDYKRHFSRQRYCGLDLGVGDAQWDYSRLDAVGDLAALPFAEGVFDAAINVVTLEHVHDPARVVCELAARPGAGRSPPVDRAARMGRAPAATRLLSRRLLNALQFFPGPLSILAAVFFAPPALVLPLLDFLDKRRNFTLRYICSARKPS